MSGTSFSIQFKCFNAVGFKQVERSKIFHVFHITSLLLLTLSLISELSFIVQNAHDILASAEASGPFATVLNAFAKFVTFYVWKEKFYSIVAQVQALSAKGKICLK